MPSIRAPATKRTTTLTVAVKCRPLTEKERGRDIVRVNDNKEVIILDPDLSKDYLDRIQNRTKEKKYCFDHAFGPHCTNLDVYKRGISSIVSGVVQGLNATIFAYGSTGSGKTYTMVGTQEDPGLMVLSLHTIFALIKKDKSSDEFEVSCSYLEVYNEVIYDLLEKSSGHLELREDPQQGIMIVGLRCIKVHSADKILELLNLGNSRRKTESTEANATSSRSHAVLEITVKRKQRNKYQNQVMRGKLALVDLAGSERASETNSGGQKLRDGANINRSLLALANCINALGKQQKKGLAYVPYRNSKLTRILKDGLSGNSQTVMVATISPADNQYHHTINTLKYADRAKEIKTHIQKNIGMIDTHVSDYQRMIDSLQAIEREGAVVETLRARQQVILDNIRDNDEVGINYQKEIEENEKHRCQLQDMIEKAISKDGNKTYLRILSQYRLLGMANTELQFEMAMRDQIIHNQREAQRNLWNLLMGLGLEEKHLLDFAVKHGIIIEDWMMMPHLGISDKKQSSVSAFGRYVPMGYSQCSSQSFSGSCIFQHYQDFGSRSFSRGPWDASGTFCREEHHSSYYMLSNDLSPPAYLRLRKSANHWIGGAPDSWFGTPAKRPQNLRSSCPELRNWTSPCCEGFPSGSSLSADLSYQHKETWNNASRQHLYKSPNAGMSGGQTMMGNGGTARGSSAQLSGLHSSNHIFQHTEPSSGPNISHVPSFATAGTNLFCNP
ncbi:kinesin-like protein KIN-8B isoform X2 [Hevea brasiliensis]|uniref:kinesin-like protein KIN-8B isoform X2 n=1 Tax=Hevea brasiliensis TaxID=3981 RepID=UPI0025F74A95|nr:kinesin-like protein KIN-8B isoform X2 [Hevea brasiliensis]